MDDFQRLLTAIPQFLATHESQLHDAALGFFVVGVLIWATYALIGRFRGKSVSRPSSPDPESKPGKSVRKAGGT
jgi:hypothetical protein